MDRGFLFVPDFEVFANALSTDDRHAFIDAVIAYGLHGTEPSFEQGSGLCLAWLAVKMTFDRLNANSEKRAKAGKAGGLMNRKEDLDAEPDNAEAKESKPKQTEANGSKLKQNEISEASESKIKQTEADESKKKQIEASESKLKPDTDTDTVTYTDTNSFLFAPDDESTAAPPNEKAKARDNPSSKAAKIDFDFDKKEWVNITDEWIAFWRKTYPAVDVEAELQRMAAWLVTDPTRKKKNYAKAINFWLGKEQDRGGRKNGRTQYGSVAGAGGLDPGGRPEVIRGADYGTGANIYDFIGGGGDKESGNS